MSVILLTLPDAFVGGILALLLTGETLNVSSAVGFIGLFGIAVQNGLVLIAQTRGLMQEGLSAVDAERQCCRFLRFGITVEPDGGAIFLELSGPPGTREFVAALLEM